MRYLKGIRSISSVVGNWYKVTGDRNKPEFTRIAVWAVISTAEVPDGDEPEYVYDDIIVGLPISHLGSAGLDVDSLINNVAGYVELNENDVLKAKENPLLLPHEDLVWE